MKKIICILLILILSAGETEVKHHYYSLENGSWIVK